MLARVRRLSKVSLTEVKLEVLMDMKSGSERVAP